MRRILSTLWDTGFRLRCPVCEQGRLFDGWFEMRPVCPHCSVRFERYDGEVTGGMTVSVVVTCLAFLFGVMITEFILHWPLWFQLLLWVAFAVGFPILFYRYSRALWVALLYFSGDVFWDREPYVESERSIVDAFFFTPSSEGPPPDTNLSDEASPPFPNIP